MLHITNGDCAVEVLERAVQGEFLPWRDALHEGPVHAGIPLQDLSRRRAAFIAGAGWAPLVRVQESFIQRDATLVDAMRHEEVVLWFEHDLYDQLQLIQVLDWFRVHPHPKLSLVCEAEYLGTMTPGRAADLFRERSAVTDAQLRAGSAAWGVFASAHPTRITQAFNRHLPFLGPALRRLLEEYPWAGDGLSRLERQAMEALQGGPLPFEELFPRAHQRREEPVFLADAVFAWHLERLKADGFVEGAWSLTQKGRSVLEGKADAWAQPRRARWLGGYEVKDGRLRWDPGLAYLVRA
ncbi:MAG: hypothetical protein ACREUN_00470 [Burkholderiales bacterium]